MHVEVIIVPGFFLQVMMICAVLLAGAAILVAMMPRRQPRNSVRVQVRRNAGSKWSNKEEP